MGGCADCLTACPVALQAWVGICLAVELFSSQEARTGKACRAGEQEARQEALAAQQRIIQGGCHCYRLRQQVNAQAAVVGKARAFKVAK
ncbi:hypothetical protein D3C84_847660 [compost metagenome]